MTRRRGQVLSVLAALGQPARAWPSLMHGTDPGVRTELIHDLAGFGADPRSLIARLARETEPSARRALILALGEFDPTDIPSDEHSALIRKFLDDYGHEGDPGLHSALDWLLRQRWGAAAQLERLDRELAGSEIPQDRRWFVNSRVKTYAVVRGPVEFVMGSPSDEDGREPGESPHLVRIERSFAIATREITVAEYREYAAEHPAVARDFELIVRVPEQPIVGIDWYEAARYCNWLNQQEGIPEDQWCYPREIGPGMILQSDCRDRMGYRLPTEAEWEFACRAGALTSRPYGSSPRLLGKYGWFVENSSRIAQPVGRLKPNDLGLFDILGNAFEWTQDPLDSYRIRVGGAIPDTRGPISITDEVNMVLRGGSFLSQSWPLRSANRRGDRPFYSGNVVGFRLAQTLR
jgi:formylglycine-generating enzyme required for sulfatase activity